MKFKPLYQPTHLEQAQTRYQQAQTDQIYLTTDVVSPEEIALSRFGGDEYSAETHVDFDARDAQEAVIAPIVDADPEPPPTSVQLPDDVALIEQGMPPAAGKPEGKTPETGVED